jgi:hypothetical protein
VHQLSIVEPDRADRVVDVQVDGGLARIRRKTIDDQFAPQALGVQPLASPRPGLFAGQEYHHLAGERLRGLDPHAEPVGLAVPDADHAIPPPRPGTGRGLLLRMVRCNSSKERVAGADFVMLS